MLPEAELDSTVRPLESLAVAPDPDFWMVLVVRPLASRKVVLLSDRDSVRSLRPAAFRYVVWLPDCVAVQTVRPEASLKTVSLPWVVAVPVVRPALSRKAVRLPVALAVPTVRPEASLSVVWLPGTGLVAMCRLRSSAPGTVAFLASAARNAPAVTARTRIIIGKCFISVSNCLLQGDDPGGAAIHWTRDPNIQRTISVRRGRGRTIDTRGVKGYQAAVPRKPRICPAVALARQEKT